MKYIKSTLAAAVVSMIVSIPILAKQGSAIVSNDTGYRIYAAGFINTPSGSTVVPETKCVVSNTYNPSNKSPILKQFIDSLSNGLQTPNVNMTQCIDSYEMNNALFPQPIGYINQNNNGYSPYRIFSESMLPDYNPDKHIPDKPVTFYYNNNKIGTMAVAKNCEYKTLNARVSFYVKDEKPWITISNNGCSTVASISKDMTTLNAVPPQNSVVNKTSVDLTLFPVTYTSYSDNKSLINPTEASVGQKKYVKFNIDKTKIGDLHVTGTGIPLKSGASAYKIYPTHAFWAVTLSSAPDKVVALITTTYNGNWEGTKNPVATFITENGMLKCNVTDADAEGIFECNVADPAPAIKPNLACKDFSSVLKNNKYKFTYLDENGNSTNQPDWASSKYDAPACDLFSGSDKVKVSGYEQAFIFKQTCQKGGYRTYNDRCTYKVPSKITTIITVKYK